MSDETSLNQLALFAEASPAKTLALPEIGRAWLESDQGFGSSSIEFSRSLGRLGLLSKTSPVFYPATEGKILPPSFVGWSNAGMASLGGFSTLNILESPNAAAVCGLLEVLEADVPPKYFLSPRACQGILNRAARRGRPLPEHLHQTLTRVAQEQPDPETNELKQVS